jgi:hypothetical protein
VDGYIARSFIECGARRGTRLYQPGHDDPACACIKFLRHMIVIDFELEEFHCTGAGGWAPISWLCGRARMSKQDQRLHVPYLQDVRYRIGTFALHADRSPPSWVAFTSWMGRLSTSTAAALAVLRCFF